VFSFDFGSIWRYMSVHAGDPTINLLLQPQSPYEPAATQSLERLQRSRGLVIEDETRPPRNRKDKYIPLKRFPVPTNWRSKVVSRKAVGALSETYHAGLAVDNYRAVFQHFLWLEEIALTENALSVTVNGYSIRAVAGKSSGEEGLMELSVSSMDEMNMTVGDSLTVAPVYDRQAHGRTTRRVSRPSCYRGKITAKAVARKRGGGHVLLVKFDPIIEQDSSMCGKVLVRFELNRKMLRICHQALQLADDNLIRNLMFPSRVDIWVSGGPDESVSDERLLGIIRTKFPLFDPTKTFGMLNDRQKQAVKGVLSGLAYPAPYVLLGPPGTGKTMTLVEIISQFRYGHGKDAGECLRVLAVTPSNAAADVLVERLSAYMSTADMCRLMSVNRRPADVSETVKRHCKTDEGTGAFVQMKSEELTPFSVVVSTCAMASRLYNQGYSDLRSGSSKFDLVIVDECSSAWECEILSALVGLINPTAQVL
jgi:hypothetical protein